MAVEQRGHLRNRPFLCIVAVAWALYAITSLRAASQPPATVDERGLIAIARGAVVSEVTGKPARGSQSGVSAKSPPKPVFVTIERKSQVLGCRGSLECRTRSLKEEVALAARAARREAGQGIPHTESRTYVAVRRFLLAVLRCRLGDPAAGAG